MWVQYLNVYVLFKKTHTYRQTRSYYKQNKTQTEDVDADKRMDHLTFIEYESK